MEPQRKGRPCLQSLFYLGFVQPGRKLFSLESSRLSFVWKITGRSSSTSSSSKHAVDSRGPVVAVCVQELLRDHQQNEATNWYTSVFLFFSFLLDSFSRVTPVMQNANRNNPRPKSSHLRPQRLHLIMPIETRAYCRPWIDSRNSVLPAVKVNSHCSGTVIIPVASRLSSGYALGRRGTRHGEWFHGGQMTPSRSRARALGSIRDRASCRP